MSAGGEGKKNFEITKITTDLYKKSTKHHRTI
jgi:hypothetical protein